MGGPATKTPEPLARVLLSDRGVGVGVGGTRAVPSPASELTPVCTCAGPKKADLSAIFGTVKFGGSIFGWSMKITFFGALRLGMIF